MVAARPKTVSNDVEVLVESDSAFLQRACRLGTGPGLGTIMYEWRISNSQQTDATCAIITSVIVTIMTTSSRRDTESTFCMYCDQ